MIKDKTRSYYTVYIMTNKNNNVLYTGMTNNINRRVYEHKNKIFNGFTKKYNIDKLVYFEKLKTLDEAVNREKQIKAGSRKKKIELINNQNNEWKDLSGYISGVCFLPAADRRFRSNKNYKQ
jgi:putative endonuclease